MCSDYGWLAVFHWGPRGAERRRMTQPKQVYSQCKNVETFPLEKIAEAQQEFTKKGHVGKFVLIPPPLTREQEELFSNRR